MHVIVPALDEEAAIVSVIRSLKAAGFEHIVVVDNGSRDRTAQLAVREGACVVSEPARGYGAACLAGMAALGSCAGTDIVAFIDADGSDDARDLHLLLAPLQMNQADLVLGSRTSGVRERGALPAHARVGNSLASWLIKLRTGYRFTDLGPMRALRYTTLMNLGMKDRNFGWTVEMQLKATRKRLRVVEVPVSYRRRVGQSKISGTVSGSVRAGLKILATIARHGR
ncbi:MAG: glycosyltransferase family 2 protein [Gemmatimonadota bacterium]